jgi:hypothetical protein
VLEDEEREGLFLIAEWVRPLDLFFFDFVLVKGGLLSRALFFWGLREDVFTDLAGAVDTRPVLGELLRSLLALGVLGGGKTVLLSKRNNLNSRFLREYFGLVLACLAVLVQSLVGIGGTVLLL